MGDARASSGIPPDSLFSPGRRGNGIVVPNVVADRFLPGHKRFGVAETMPESHPVDSCQTKGNWCITMTSNEHGERLVPTICGFCHTNCGMIAHVSGGKLKKVRGNPDHPANGGHLCVKGFASPEVVHSPHRLTSPLMRTEGGFKAVSWDEALGFMADRLLDIRSRHGARALFQCGGAPVTEEARDGFAQLMAAYGSPNRTGSGHLCSQPRKIALGLVFGRRPECDYAQANLIMVWAANPLGSMRPSEATAYGRFHQVLPEAKKRGCRIIVIDPVRSPTADLADEWVPIYPGTDAALGLAMLNVIIGEGLYDQGFVDEWTTGFPELRDHVRTLSPEWAEPLTGVPAGKIRELAMTYATTRPAALKDGNGLDMHPNSVQTARLLGMLEAVTGNVDNPGGNVFFPAPQLSAYPTVKPEGQRLGADNYPLYPEVVFPEVVDALLTGDPYQPRAMIVYHANPALINANPRRVSEALSKLELLVVCDIFLTATAALADLVLPETSDLERFGFRTYASAEGGVVALRQPVADAVGQSRPVFEVEYELGQRMGLAAFFPWTNTREWMDYRLRSSEVTVKQLEAQPVLYTTPPMEYRKYLRAGFATPSGKIELYSEKLNRLGQSPIPTFVPPPESTDVRPEASRDFPLLGTSRKLPMYVHTRFRNIPRLNKLHPLPVVTIHPQDAGARGIEDGTLVVVSSPRGKIELKASVSPETQPGQVVVDFGWGNPSDDGYNVNELVDDGDRDPIAASTPNRRFLCEVRRVDA